MTMGIQLSVQKHEKPTKNGPIGKPHPGFPGSTETFDFRKTKIE